MNNINCKKFGEIDINDKFFDSLKEDYSVFTEWFEKKENNNAFVQYNSNGTLDGFLYLKIEKDVVDDVFPQIKAKKILKVGTFKINAHGTKMGEQFIKVITDIAISEDVDICYVTIFKKHSNLINLIERFGFKEYGKKYTDGKEETVYLKNMRGIVDDILLDYPIISNKNVKKYLLSVYPRYHSVMFPDSILKTENKDIIKDISYTNSIHKIYVCSMSGVKKLKYGDIIVIYRTKDGGKAAEYSSVATSICVVEEVRTQYEFNNFEDFYKYSSQYSVFDKNDLKKWYDKGGCIAIKMTYNVALNKRITRHDLIEEVGIDRESNYWGFVDLTDGQFEKIIHYGKVNPRILHEHMF